MQMLVYHIDSPDSQQMPISVILRTVNKHFFTDGLENVIVSM